MRELKQHLLAELKISVTALRRLVNDLEDAKEIESEQYQSNEKVYFLRGRTPRVRVRRVPAAEVSMPAMPPCSWFSSLGSIACQ